MTTAGLIILIALVFVAALIYMELGGLPGKTARERGHPQANAISVLGWLGLLFGFPWLVAMVWARMQPLHVIPDSTQKPVAETDDEQ